MYSPIKAWRNCSVRHKLLVLFVGVIALPASLTIYLANYVSQMVVKEQPLQGLRLDALTLSSAIERRVQDRVSQVESYADSVVMLGPRVLNNPARGLELKEARHHGEQILLRQPSFLSITVLDRSGSERLRVGRPADPGLAARLDAFAAAWSGQPVVASPRTPAGTEEATVEIAAPITGADQTVLAIVLAEVRLSALLPVSEEGAAPSSGLQSFLLDADGIRIWDSISPRNLFKPVRPLSAERRAQMIASQRFGASTPERIKTASPITGYSGALENRESGDYFDAVREGVPAKGVYVDLKVDGLGAWRLVHVVPQSDYLSSVEETASLTILASIGAAIASLALGLGLSRVITRPISDLNVAFEQFARGKDASLEFDTDDEIGCLARSFNQMVLSVKSFQFEVEEQNRDLSYANRKMKQLNADLEKTVCDRTRQIEEEKEILDAVVSHTGVALSILDGDQTVTWSNEQTAEGFERITAMRAEGKLTTETGGTCEWPVRLALRDGKIHRETVLVDGTDTWWLVTAVPMQVSSGESHLVLEMVQDVTDQKGAARQMLQAEKMSSIGYLASGIAHEFNNIMCAILGHANLAKQNPARAERFADVAIRQCDRAAKITQGLLNMSRRKESVMKYADLQQLTDEVLTLLESEMSKAQIELSRTYSGDASTLVNEGHFQQMILSLIRNACQAIVRNGRIGVTITSDGKTITLKVRDDGCGIPPEQRDKVFEPFFTTKGALGVGDQPGTGLGLSAVYNIVTIHGGTVGLESELDVGTTFTITIPVRQERRGTAQPVDVEEDRRVADLTSAPLQVLVADDEEDLRNLMRTIMTFEKHEVDLAVDAEEALTMAAKHAYDIVFLDMQMPGSIDSATALEEIKRKTPRTQVILISGADLDADQQEAYSEADAFVQKPFSNDAILRLLTRKETL